VPLELLDAREAPELMNVVPLVVDSIINDSVTEVEIELVFTVVLVVTFTV